MNTQRTRILVADDEPATQRNIEKTLEKEGYSVKTASNADQVLQEINQHSFDLIILDIRMPDSTAKLSKRAGVDALQKIRAKGLDIPVIMLSATLDSTLVAEALSYSTTRFFLKGEISHVKLIKTIKELLGH